MKLTESIANKALKNIKVTYYWTGTPLETYEHMNPRSKGSFGEEIAKEIIKENYNFNIEKRTDPGHDAIISDIKAEIKFSAATKRNYDYRFTFNHVGIGKTWKRIVFVGVNGDLNIIIKWFTKDDIISILNEKDSCIKHQQGGKKSENDDYCIMNEDSIRLLNHPLAKNMDQW